MEAHALGVKWNACDVTRRGYGRTGRVRYRFMTPYGPPSAFLDFVAARYPEVAMSLSYDVESLGCGMAACAGGRRISIAWPCLIRTTSPVFVEAQDHTGTYDYAVRELRAGRKTSH